jgi:hypothetical protein
MGNTFSYNERLSRKSTLSQNSQYKNFKLFITRYDDDKIKNHEIKGGEMLNAWDYKP